jgi:deazaflavin-dependent oxidoreductase (nitroreductase family)
MSYLKPPALTVKVFNKLAMRSARWGVHTLEVAGRKTGAPQRVPVIPLEHDGTLYVVSTRGEAEWVRNVRAAGALRLGRKGDFTTYRAEEVPVDGRSDIIAAYRAKAGREVNGYFAKLPADADHPVFRLTR